VRFGIALLVVGLAAGHVSARQSPEPPASATGSTSRSIWGGVYTLEQAKRGALTSGLCVQCHGDGFVGGPAPELAGPAFGASWNGRTLGDLFDLIRLTMPDDDPGSLSREVYADLVAYILSVNRYPTGQMEIGTDASALKLIRIDPKPLDQ